MNIKLLFSTLLFFVLVGVQAQAQSCTYRLELYDSFGDGWNGANLKITIRDSIYTFTLNRMGDNGFFRVFQAEVMDSDSATLLFTSGGFDSEIRFAIYNPENILIYAAAGASLLPGIPITAVLECPSCLVSDPATVKTIDVRAYTASVAWKAPMPGNRYLVEYGIKDFVRGSGSFATTLDTSIVLRNLQENTEYQYYLSTICTAGDTSRAVGPYNFKTLWAKNVGVIAITTPDSKCGLGAGETVTITLKNFGGNPQTLFPYKFSVNGLPVSIPIPQDGLFTGVLGKDSTFTIEFDTKFDFSEPNEYVIEAWTELENDSNTSNDTTRVTIINIPNVTTYPYFEDFEEWGGGWTVADSSRNPSWEYGRPSGRIINAAAGGMGAWVTNLDTAYNNNELSYLVSPCLDFSGMTQDPRINFSLNFLSEACCDEGWLEVSIDGGDTWTKVGSDSTGLNWYNDAGNQWWDGDGGLEGWHTASNILTGTKVQANVRLRFVFSSDFSSAREGMAIDNVFISEPLARDLAALSAKRSNTDVCGNAMDRLQLLISNFGSAPLTGFNVGYTINGGTPVIENVGAFGVAAGAQATYTFTQTFNSTTSGTYEIVAWTAATGELFPSNDTTLYRFNTALPVPFAEDFERGSLPAGWQSDAGTDVGQGHGNQSYVISDNLSNIDRRMELITPPVGLIEMGDSLTFQYRITNFSGNGTVAKTLGVNDSLAVQISTNCGQSYITKYLINAQNHRPDTALQKVVIYLDDYVGSAIRVRFLAGWGTGDYWVDLDNINIIRCPASLDLTTEVKDESVRGATDGQAIVSADIGTAPFTYLWSNGATDKINAKLATGAYQVTVTDRYGCSDVAFVMVGLTTGLEKIESFSRVNLAPNPTSGQTILKVELRQASTLQVQVFNTSGQLIFQTQEGSAATFLISLDLSAQPAGLYIIRLRADNQTRSEKLLKLK